MHRALISGEIDQLLTTLSRGPDSLEEKFIEQALDVQNYEPVLEGNPGTARRRPR
jgi:hypothetical protein